MSHNTIFHCLGVWLRQYSENREREIEILKLIAESYESKEIANKLFSFNIRIDTHRRNMINRMGVIDTTALMHLSRLCEMI